MARVNHGRYRVELIRPCESYERLLRLLAAGLPGLMGTIPVNPYRMVLRIAEIFEPRPIGEAIARRLLEELFPDQSLSFEVLEDSSAADCNSSA